MIPLGWIGRFLLDVPFNSPPVQFIYSAPKEPVKKKTCVVEFPRICPPARPPARQIFLLDFNADFSTFLYKIHDEILQHHHRLFFKSEIENTKTLVLELRLEVTIILKRTFKRWFR